MGIEGSAVRLLVSTTDWPGASVTSEKLKNPPGKFKPSGISAVGWTTSFTFPTFCRVTLNCHPLPGTTSSDGALLTRVTASHDGHRERDGLCACD